MFAIVEADMSTSPSAPRCSRSADSGALVSENGTDAASLISCLRCDLTRIYRSAARRKLKSHQSPHYETTRTYLALNILAAPRGRDRACASRLRLTSSAAW